MGQHDQIAGVGGIYAVLAAASNRPRYAFLVLQLVAEAADHRGQAGPFILDSGQPVLLRDWLCMQLMPMSEQATRRAALRARVSASFEDELTGNAQVDEAMIDAAVEEQVLAVGRANVSRAISDLVRAGLVTRHYAGYATNHKNRGGGRRAVYVVKPGVLRLLRRPAAQSTAPARSAPRQGDLFAA
ncbi:MAG: hypothetical protein KGL48_11200 [Sphingomonadales bacterium]|nr:hypothetical protein [Sphingomonadales bacterium]